MPSPCPRMLHAQYGGASDERQSPPSPWKASRLPVGAGSHQPACGGDRLRISGALRRRAARSDASPVQSFKTFTSDLVRLADWLVACGVTSVAMEATGVYWIPIYEILEARGFEVLLVNARHIKNVPGRKSDVSDCEWLRELHSVGLLRGSFRPTDAIVALRAYMRHRQTLVESAGTYVQRMQKAFVQMNLQLPLVVSDITGVTGPQDSARHCRRPPRSGAPRQPSRLSVSRLADRDHRRLDRPLSARAPLRLATESGTLRHVSDANSRPAIAPLRPRCRC